MKDFIKRTFGGGGGPAPIGRRFENKVVVVTGASAGIGLATAVAFAREGGSVALLARREAAGEKALERVKREGAEGMFIQADVKDRSQVRDAFMKIAERWSRIDVAVNNAGVIHEGHPVASLDESEFDRVMAVNVKGTWLCMREEIPLMEERGGSIVNLGSISSLTALPNLGAYVTSKHAVAGLTKSAALDYVSKGIRVNAVCPGYVHTDMTRGVTQEILKRRVPMARWIEPEEVAETILWMCSDAAKSMVGECLVMDGGVLTRY
jgi:NAD(P)-dependent dehydrogenase (short-subunit alcohol dehydrogenase family)